jgi:hypothetical protein
VVIALEHTRESFFYPFKPRDPAGRRPVLMYVRQPGLTALRAPVRYLLPRRTATVDVLKPCIIRIRYSLHTLPVPSRNGLRCRINISALRPRKGWHAGIVFQHPRLLFAFVILLHTGGKQPYLGKSQQERPATTLEQLQKKLLYRSKNNQSAARSRHANSYSIFRLAILLLLPPPLTRTDSCSSSRSIVKMASAILLSRKSRTTSA